MLAVWSLRVGEFLDGRWLVRPFQQGKLQLSRWKDGRLSPGPEAAA